MLQDKDQSLTDLEKLGEFSLIELLTKDFELKNKESKKGVGDDCAVIEFKESDKCVVTKDLLVEGVHFDLSYVPLKHLGYKSVMVNLSDVCAMNARPTQILIGIAVSSRFSLEALQEFYSGVKLACDDYGVDLVGGDTTSSSKGMLISITAIGRGREQELVYRNGAKEHDLLVVSGDLGSSYMGLQILEREKAVFKVNPNIQPDLSPYSYLIQRQLKPQARLDIVELLSKLGVKPTSMIDISDGLSSEIIHICTQSGVGCRLVEDKIPLDPQLISTCEEFSFNSTMAALSGGEDYELLFTIKQSDYDKIKGNPNLTVIGYITSKDEGINMITRANELIPITSRGWNAFKENN